MIFRKELIKGQRFKGSLYSGWGTIVNRNDYKRSNGKTLEAYCVVFDNGKQVDSWWRVHVDYVEPRLFTWIRNKFNQKLRGKK